MWQPKAWYDSATCNRWVNEYAIDEILKSDLEPGTRHLILADNLGGQTKKTNPQFAKLLDKNCSADLWNLLAGCTDEIQVVDAGFGALTKRCTEDVQMEWLQCNRNWAEWTGPNLSASRKRVLCTLWYGEGYERACDLYNFEAVFDRTGGSLAPDGSMDSCIKLQGLEEFSYCLEDAQRDALSGLMPGEQEQSEALGEADAMAENDERAVASDGEEMEELSENSGSDSEEGGETTDEECDGEEFEVPKGYMLSGFMEPDNQAGFSEEELRVGAILAHRWDIGWCIGEVKRKVTMSATAEQNGKYACKYPDSRREFFHDLFDEDYGVKKMWVLLEEDLSDV